MRHARRAARGALVGSVLAAILTSLLPALPVVARGPVKVTGREVHTAVDHQRTVQLPITASHVALKWRGAPDATVSVAFGMKPNELGEEVPLGVVDADEAPDTADLTTHGKSRNGPDETYSDVLWTGGARFARVTTDRPLGQLTVLAMDAQADVGPEVSPANVADAAVDQPAIIRRSGWGADESIRFDGGGHETWPAEFSPMQKAIVHHTAGRNNDPNPAATIRAIYYMDTISRGWGDMGYNFLIDESGRIYEGRYSRPYDSGETPTGEDLGGNVVRGGHARDWNDGTVGIVLLGNFQDVQPTAAARTSLERLLAWKLERHGLDPLAQSMYTNPNLGNMKVLYNISGHRNVASTACPGGTFYATFPQLRQAVADRISGTTGPSHDTTPPTITTFGSMLHADPTGGSTIDFGIVFSEPVEGLQASDFDVGGSSHGWNMTDISGGPEGYTIEVSAAHPDDGTIQLAIAADAVTDLAGLSGPADPATTEASFARDTEAPTVEIYAAPHKKYITDATLNYFNVTATFSEPVMGFTTSDVQLGGTSHDADHWNVPIIFGGGASYGFSAINHSWVDGTLTMQIPAGAVTDLAGNPVAASNLITIYLDAARPVTSWPRVSLQQDTTLGAGLRALISWSSSDVGPSGIASYDLARSVDGQPFTVFAGAIADSSVWSAVRPGHTYRFEVRARDWAGNVGYWVAGPTLRPALVQQTNTAVHFYGPSKRTSSSVYSGGSERYLAAKGSSAVFKTTARSLSFVTTRAPGRGSVRIYVDGVYQTTINLSAGSATYRYVAYSKTWGTVGTHRIKVVAVGNGRVDVDAFGVIR